jgi:ABC-type glucose/galactose transport system permease subunit
MDVRWTLAWLGLWVASSLLLIHFALHGGTDLSAGIVIAVAAVVTAVIVQLTRKVLRRAK